MIDIETRKIVDVLESRDGSIVYNKAIKDAHPNAIQGSDRFHILKNLTDYCKKYIVRNFYRKVEIGKLENINQNKIIKLKEKYKFEIKWELIQRVQELRKLNYRVEDISKILEIGSKTVATYSKIVKEDREKYNKIINKKSKLLEIAKKKEKLMVILVVNHFQEYLYHH